MHMNKILSTGSHLTAILGALVCLLAGFVRLGGSSYALGFESLTLFIGGIALMVFSGLLKLELVYQSFKHDKY